MKSDLTPIPRYFLLTEDNRRDGPRCRDHAGKTCTAIYGFANREAYDAFSIGISESRRPYPLISGHLASAVAGPGLQLIVLNAIGPHETSLDAATAEEVLAAQHPHAGPLAASYRLSLAADSTAYHVERFNSCGEDAVANRPSPDKPASVSRAPH